MTDFVYSMLHDEDNLMALISGDIACIYLAALESDDLMGQSIKCIPCNFGASCHEDIPIP
jgi:hypothetical protein